jgi:hypothetical protein
VKGNQVANSEHLLTIVEPSPGGDSTLDLAHETVERGGTASILMVITDRVQHDIRDFAQSENLHERDAEALALDRYRAYCAERVGGSPRVEVHFGNLRTGLHNHLTADTTGIALPKHLGSARRIRRDAAKARIPIFITPDRAA